MSQDNENVNLCKDIDNRLNLFIFMIIVIDNEWGN